jgi:small-conductance mechanosensitive channel
MSNADVLKSRVRNYGRLRERRSAFELTLTYDTPLEVLRAIPEAVRGIIEGQPSTRFDRCHLMSYAPTGLTFEIVYFVTVPDFKVYADLQQTINIAILERFRELGVQFATPVLSPMPTYTKPAVAIATAPAPAGTEVAAPAAKAQATGNSPPALGPAARTATRS